MSVYDKISPFASNEERLTTEALVSNTAPAEEVQSLIRPPIPQISLFPPLLGYRPYEDRQATIDDVLGEDRMLADRRTSLSGGEGAWTASARFVNGPYY